SLKHLSAGQGNLLNVFLTILRYADVPQCKSIDDVAGIVLIDEVDAHLHADLQYSSLPKLMKLFPRVQFVVGSHAPTFLLGMEREYGAEGVAILEFPTGERISSDRFAEFQRSLAHYKQTKAFEADVRSRVLASAKPHVLLEGEFDVSYLR